MGGIKLPQFSDGDIAVLKRLISEFNNKPRNERYPNPPPALIRSTGCYIAYSADGIPALTADSSDTGTGGGGDIPGEAECDLYRIQPWESPDTTLGLIGLPTQKIYNLSSSRISGWFLAHRAKQGEWIAGAGTGGSPLRMGILLGTLESGKSTTVQFRTISLSGGGTVLATNTTETATIVDYLEIAAQNQIYRITTIANPSYVLTVNGVDTDSLLPTDTAFRVLTAIEDALGTIGIVRVSGYTLESSSIVVEFIGDLSGQFVSLSIGVGTGSVVTLQSGGSKLASGTRVISYEDSDSGYHVLMQAHCGGIDADDTTGTGAT